MEKTRNPCIVSLFMRNINPKTVELQNKVVKKFNKSEVAHYPILTDHNPGYSMDLANQMTMKKHDAIMFLDIDAVPVSANAIDYFFDQAYAGKVIGSAQRSNHIQNNQHVFCAPHNVTFSFETFEKCGKPSFLPNYRGDVSEEMTWRARENNVEIEILMPTRFDAPPIRMDWEPKDLPPYWDLADGMPKYGIGTTFGHETLGEMFWHCFQSYQPGQQERFWNKCEELLSQ